MVVIGLNLFTNLPLLLNELAFLIISIKMHCIDPVKPHENLKHHCLTEGYIMVFIIIFHYVFIATALEQNSIKLFAFSDSCCDFANHS